MLSRYAITSVSLFFQSRIGTEAYRVRHRNKFVFGLMGFSEHACEAELPHVELGE